MLFPGPFQELNRTRGLLARKHSVAEVWGDGKPANTYDEQEAAGDCDAHDYPAIRSWVLEQVWDYSDNRIQADAHFPVYDCSRV